MTRPAPQIFALTVSASTSASFLWASGMRCRESVFEGEMCSAASTKMQPNLSATFRNSPENALDFSIAFSEKEREKEEDTCLNEK